MTESNGLARQPGGGLATAPGQFERLVEAPIRTPHDLAQTVRELQAQCFILSPAIAVSSIAQGYVVNRAVVAIDPNIDPNTGRGADVYHQPSMHKKEKRGQEWIPLEVSLSKNALIRIMSAAGVDITSSARMDNGREPYYWAWDTQGTIIDFDGRKRRLPPGNVEIDYRDGAASIGEWTPERWAQAEQAAEQRRRQRNLSKDDAWKEKPEPINGWTAERVMNARRFGLRIAEAESLNRLIRNLGIKQTYSIKELQAKPFLIMRCSPDMSDPEVKRMVLASHLGATELLYPRAALTPARASDVIDMEPQDPNETIAHNSPSGAVASEPPASSSRTPAGALEFDEVPSAPPVPEPARRFTIVKASLLEIAGRPHYFFETKEGVTFVTEDATAARSLNAARKAEKAVPIEGERVELNGGIYFTVIECPPASALLPDLGKV